MTQNPIRSNQIECVPFDDAWDVLGAFSEGRIGVVESSKVVRSEVLAWNSKTLVKNHPKAWVSVHTKLSGDGFDYDLRRMDEFWKPVWDFRGREDDVTVTERRSMYGVTNSRRLTRSDPVIGPLRDKHSRQLSFIWLGLSPGGLHCDYFDNVLTQVAGKKRVAIFPPAVSDKISTEHYVPLPDATDPFSSENSLNNPWLSSLPFVEIDLSPGDTVVIPSGAYHSVRALTAESVSVNSFFIPRTFSNFRSEHARKEDWYPWSFTTVVIDLSRLSHRLTGRPIKRTGHYEIM